MNDTSSTPSTTPIPNNYGVATSMADVQNQINEMEAFFETGATLPVDFRLRQLRRLPVPAHIPLQTASVRCSSASPCRT